MGLQRDRVVRTAIGFTEWTGTPVRAVAGAGLRAGQAAWTGLVPRPAQRPFVALLDAAQRRGSRDITRLRAAAAEAALATLDDVLAGPLADEVAERIVAHRILERVTAHLLRHETLERMLVLADERHVGARAGDALLDRHAADRAVAYLLAHPAFERLLAETLACEAFERRFTALLDDPVLDRLMAQTLASRFAHEATDRLLTSDELQQIVGEIARSDDVRAALQDQSAGLATEVADDLRDRTMDLDEVLERGARRLLRRRRRSSPVVAVDDGARR
jgi:hypothetical protein